MNSWNLPSYPRVLQTNEEKVRSKTGEEAEVEKELFPISGREGWIHGEGAGTMKNRFEDLWDSAAGEGASTPVGVVRPAGDFDALMDAWFRERHDSIEYRLHLEEAGDLLRQILEQDQVPLKLRRRAKHLLQAIRAVHEPDRGNTHDPD